MSVGYLSGTFVHWFRNKVSPYVVSYCIMSTRCPDKHLCNTGLMCACAAIGMYTPRSIGVHTILGVTCLHTVIAIRTSL